LKQSHNKLLKDNKFLETENSRLKLENEKFKGKNEELVNMTKLFFDLELKLKQSVVKEMEEKDSEEEEKKTRLREHLSCLSISTVEEDIKTEEELEVLKENFLSDENLIEDVSPPKFKKNRSFKL
jgi:hypothetical protein